MSESESKHRTEEEWNSGLKSVLTRFPAKVNTQGTFGGFLDAVSIPHDHDEVLQANLRAELDMYLDNTMLRPATRKLLQRPIDLALDLGIDHANIEKETLYRLLGLDLGIQGIYNPFNIKLISGRIIKDRAAVLLEGQIMTGGQIPFDYELSEAKQDYFTQWEDEV